MLARIIFTKASAYNLQVSKPKVSNMVDDTCMMISRRYLGDIWNIMKLRIDDQYCDLLPVL